MFKLTQETKFVKNSTLRMMYIINLTKKGETIKFIFEPFIIKGEIPFLLEEK